MASAVDIFVAYKFLKILTTPWKDQDAFEHNIIDENGKTLRKSKTLKTSKEKSSYTIFHRLIFNIKRLMEKLPFGKSKLGSFALGLALLREKNTPDTDLYDFLSEENFLFDEDIAEVEEKISNVKGQYMLKAEVFISDLKSGKLGDIIEVKRNKITKILGDQVVKAIHLESGGEFYVSLADIIRVKNEKI